MDSEKLIPVRDPSEIPPSMSEEEEVKFWQTHGLSEEYFDKLKDSSKDISPRETRSRPISVRFREGLLRQLRELADKLGKPYQTLLKEFVIEGLDREEAATKLGTVDAQSSEILHQILEQLEGYGSMLVEIQKSLEEHVELGNISRSAHEEQLQRERERADRADQRAEAAERRKEATEATVQRLQSGNIQDYMSSKETNVIPSTDIFTSVIKEWSMSHWGYAPEIPLWKREPASLSEKPAAFSEKDLL